MLVVKIWYNSIVKMYHKYLILQNPNLDTIFDWGDVTDADCCWTSLMTVQRSSLWLGNWDLVAFQVASVIRHDATTWRCLRGAVFKPIFPWVLPLQNLHPEKPRSVETNGGIPHHFGSPWHQIRKTLTSELPNLSVIQKCMYFLNSKCILPSFTHTSPTSSTL